MICDNPGYLGCPHTLSSGLKRVCFNGASDRNKTCPFTKVDITDYFQKERGASEEVIPEVTPIPVAAIVIEKVKRSIKDFPERFSIKAETKEESEAIQDKFFSMGIYWSSGRPEYINLPSPVHIHYNYSDESCFKDKLSQCDSQHFYEEKDSQYKDVVDLPLIDFLGTGCKRKLTPLPEKFIVIVNDIQEGNAIQSKCFDLGLEWFADGKNLLTIPGTEYIHCGYSKPGVLEMGGTTNYFNDNSVPVYTAEDFLDIEFSEWTVYLPKGKKKVPDHEFYVTVDTPEESKKVQEKFIANGILWKAGDRFVNNVYGAIFCRDFSGTKRLSLKSNFSKTTQYAEEHITAEDFLNNYEF